MQNYRYIKGARYDWAMKWAKVKDCCMHGYALLLSNTHGIHQQSHTPITQLLAHGWEVILTMQC